LKSHRTDRQFGAIAKELVRVLTRKYKLRISGTTDDTPAGHAMDAYIKTISTTAGNFSI